MSEVGALIIRLQAETAQFREDMGKVKSDLDGLKDKSGEAGQGFSASMHEARGGLMLVEDAVGVRLPRHLNALIAEIPGVGQAFAMMLPVAGVAVAIKVISDLIQKHREMKKEAEEQLNAQTHLVGTIGTVYTHLQDKLLQAGIAADELNGNHLAAVKKQLELIDSQSMEEIAQSFETLAQSAEKSLTLIKAHMWEVGSGGEGAKASLERFQAQYEMLLHTGKNDEAATTLDKKITREQAILKLMEAAASKEGTGVEQMNRRVAAVKALHDITGQVVDFDDKSIESERELLDILQAESNARDTILKTASVQKNTATQKGNIQELSAEADLQKIAAQGVEQHSQALIKLARTQAEAATANKDHGDDSIDSNLAAKKQAIEDEKQDSIDAVDAVLKSKYAAFMAELKAAGNNAGKKKALEAQWANDVRANADAVVQINADAEKQIAVATATANEQKLQLAERLSVALTRLKNAETVRDATATLDRIKADEAANDRALRLGLETEQQYVARRIALIQQERDIKIQALQDEVNAEQVQADRASGAGNLVAQNDALARKVQLQAQLNTLTTQYSTEIKSLQTDLSKMNSSWSNYFTQMKTQTMDLSTQIRTNMQASIRQFTDSFANSMAQCIVENKSLGQAVRQEAAHMLESMISMMVRWLEEWIITHTIARIFQSSTDQAAKASAASLAGANMVASWSAAPWPIDAAAPAMGATAFAAAMSFEIGGKIPGSQGPVPIVGHAGETVVTRSLTDRVERAEAWGGNRSSGNHTWNFAPQIHALDAEGVDRVLTKHASTFQRHVGATLRRMNK